jgi:hypothetical protein
VPRTAAEGADALNALLASSAGAAGTDDAAAAAPALADYIESGGGPPGLGHALVVLNAMALDDDAVARALTRRAGLVPALVDLVVSPPPPAPGARWGGDAVGALLLARLAELASSAWSARLRQLDLTRDGLPRSPPAAALVAAGGVGRLAAAIAAEPPGSKLALYLACALQSLILADAGAARAAVGSGLAEWAVGAVAAAAAGAPAAGALREVPADREWRQLWRLLNSLLAAPAAALDAAAAAEAHAGFPAALAAALALGGSSGGSEPDDDDDEEEEASWNVALDVLDALIDLHSCDKSGCPAGRRPAASAARPRRPRARPRPRGGRGGGGGSGGGGGGGGGEACSLRRSLQEGGVGHSLLVHGATAVGARGDLALHRMRQEPTGSWLQDLISRPPTRAPQELACTAYEEAACLALEVLFEIGGPGGPPAPAPAARAAPPGPPRGAAAPGGHQERRAPGAAPPAEAAVAAGTPPQQLVCSACGAGAASGQRLRRCGACREAWYCSTACQLQDWPAHRDACRAAAAAATEAPAPSSGAA